MQIHPIPSLLWILEGGFSLNHSSTLQIKGHQHKENLSKNVLASTIFYYSVKSQIFTLYSKGKTCFWNHFQEPKQCSSMNSKTCLQKVFLTTLKKDYTNGC